MNASPFPWCNRCATWHADGQHFEAPSAMRTRELEQKLADSETIRRSLMEDMHKQSERLSRFEKWFEDNAVQLANHRIGGYHFDGARIIPAAKADGP